MSPNVLNHCEEHDIRSVGNCLLITEKLITETFNFYQTISDLNKSTNSLVEIEDSLKDSHSQNERRESHGRQSNGRKIFHRSLCCQSSLELYMFTLLAEFCLLRDVPRNCV